MFIKYLKNTLILSLIIYTVYFLLTPIKFSLSVFVVLLLISAFFNLIFFFIADMLHKITKDDKK